MATEWHDGRRGRGGGAGDSFDSEGSTETVMQYLLDSSSEGSGEKTASGGGSRRHRAARAEDARDDLTGRFRIEKV